MTPDPIRPRIEMILREFSRGCSNTDKNPSECPMCFDQAVNAILATLIKEAMK